MHDKQAACIRCATGAALHSMGLRTEALARSQISGNPKPRYLKADEYTDALIKVATHNKYASVSDWTNSIEDASEAETLYDIWVNSIAHAQSSMPEEVMKAYDGTEDHIRLIEITGEVTGAYSAIDAYFCGVPAPDIIA